MHAMIGGAGLNQKAAGARTRSQKKRGERQWNQDKAKGGDVARATGANVARREAEGEGRFGSTVCEDVSRAASGEGK